MQTHWKITGSRKLILFFSGWAMDENPTLSLEAEHADICTCFDYHDLKTDAFDKWKLYDEIVLIAWSTGVWAADQIVGKMDLCINNAIAINGTPTTVDDLTGIPRPIFEGTYQNLNSQTMAKFQRRMVGSAAAFAEFTAFAPTRHLEEQKSELRSIMDVDFNTQQTGFIRWKKAIIGKNDAIFPPQNQLRYWENRTKIIEVEMPHFPFFTFKRWEDIIQLDN